MSRCFVWCNYQDGASDDELRWSIRSVWKHYERDFEIVIVGDRPSWYTGLHIPCRRLPQQPERAFRDCYNRLLTACDDVRVSSPFVWMMDDVYWLRPFTQREALAPKFYRTGRPNKKPGRNKWQKLKQKAFDEMHASGYALRDFASHMPQPIYKHSFLRMENRHNLLNGECKNWEIIYYNSCPNLSRDAVNAQKWLYRFLQPVTRSQLEIEVKPWHRFLNNGARAWSDDLKNYLAARFPDASPFERRGGRTK